MQDFDLTDNCLSAKASSTKRTYRKTASKFLSRLFYILESGKHNAHICWSADGDDICIKNPISLAEEVLPCYFKHSNYASFVRQLNMYNFKKKTSQAYSHELFKRGKPELLVNIRRKSIESAPAKVVALEYDLRENPEADVEELLQENLQYKKIQKELTVQIRVVERRAQEIKDEVNALFRETKEKEDNVTFLKQVLKQIGARYGANTLIQAIEQAACDSQLEYKEAPMQNIVQDSHRNLNPLHAFAGNESSNQAENSIWSTSMDAPLNFRLEKSVSSHHFMEYEKEYRPENDQWDFFSANEDSTRSKEFNPSSLFDLQSYRGRELTLFD